ncbi:two-component system, sensor histidine kinase YesM [Paenibacillus catalpae]|uniref:Two-component system, sensor histidine kinase YesM n=1 Tax=Paenibacillus catalpae TaxID=1045775 RepID=A0A1I1V2S3_9BACL|nr:histidine kinase [Paenibacillus catalpae]SFD77169.1 two-component system, sensor histidine kinase YesM [Paenibacillus catalpae]
MNILRRLTLYPKLVLTFLVIIIPFVTISLLMNIRSERLVRNEITGSMQAKVNYYMNALEDDFGPLVTLQQQYTLDDDIFNLSYSSIIMSDEQYTRSIMNTQKKLLILKNMSPYVEDAFVNIPALDRKISASSFNELNAEEAAALNKMANTFESPFLIYRDHLWMSLPYPNSPPIGKGFTLALEISSLAIRNSLSGFLIEGNGGAMLMSDDFTWNTTSGNVPSNRENVKTVIRDQLAAGHKSGYKVIKEENATYYGFYEKSAKLGLTLAIFVDESSFIGPLKQYSYWLWGICVAAPLLILLFSYQLYQVIHTPLKRLVGAFKGLEKGDLSVRLNYRSRDEFNYLYLQYNRTVSRLQELINEAYVHQYQIKVAELKQLQSQINPHFLYNSFFNLYRLAKLHENDKVIAFSKHLGEYFKYVTKNADFVPLEQEIKFCRSYTAIQGIRFDDHVRVEFGEVPERVSLLKVPKLFLQPLVENAYQHGLEDQIAEGLVVITFEDCGDRAEISVEDNGTLTEEELNHIVSLLNEPAYKSDSEGLRNVQMRIRLNFGEDAGLRAERGRIGGLRMTIIIPFKEGLTDASTNDRRQ